MKLNCDMGESFGCWQMGNDAAVMPWIDMANIACGFHASDPDIMSETVACAVAHQVMIGAHPGYDDKPGFGRRSIPHSPVEIRHLVAYQTGALEAICQLHGGHVAYVKPHGALYHDMMGNPAVLEAILTATAAMNRQRATPLSLMVLAQRDNRAIEAIAQQYQVSLLFEAFADRAYDEQGKLVARSQPGAVHHDNNRIRQQALELASGHVTTLNGRILSLRADTLCVHGDNPESIATIADIRKAMTV
ncbi:5-oxoprolinase subunit PxpA [Photobacterium sp. CCB-ST2H9]|uniref:5-oxoprolinase subunit PxpA n=1 Tax=unclassified Photobacterium TaxID=2628852 RepID=UPI002003CA5B|nr:5-oxoprolinase subunit PxpA [Photobacterium sp. CCB-ST2H9]UTM58413.1 5-oxoprolinase subunit PxpA [Photobacterium sp. CCB-ST2H9]